MSEKSKSGKGKRGIIFGQKRGKNRRPGIDPDRVYVPKGKWGNLRNPLTGLTPLQERIIPLLEKGIPPSQAALIAGYSPSSAKRAFRDIIPAIASELIPAIAKKAKPSHVARRIAEGLDATETKYFAKDGIVTDSRETVNYSERREAATLYTRIFGVNPERHEHSGPDGEPFQVNLKLVHFGELINKTNETSETDKTMVTNANHS